MIDQKAIEISKFLSKLEHEVSYNDGELLKKDSWNQNEILILLREVLATKAHTVKEEREILEQQLYLLKRQREPMIERMIEIEKSADRSTRRFLWSFASIFCF